MLRRINILIFCLIHFLIGQTHDPYIHSKDANLASSSLPCIVNWPLATLSTLTYDDARHLLFLGSCDHVQILDVTHPGKPEVVSVFRHSARSICDLHYQNDTKSLYLCCGVTGITIWDVADAYNPKKLSHYDTPGYACDIQVSKHNAYIADGDGGLRILDVSIPSNPREISHLELDAACSICIKNQYAYIADLGLRIIDISNPLSPVEMAFYETPGIAQCVYVDGRYAYIADDWCGLRVIDVSNNENPHEVSTYQTPGYAWDVFIEDRFAYVSVCNAGLMIIDISNPLIPQNRAFHRTSCDALHAHVRGSYIFVAASEDGLQILANPLMAAGKK